MKVTVIGTGYVGLVQSVCLAELGNEVVGVDVDEAKVKLLDHGRSPIYEPRIEELLKRNLDRGRLRFTVAYTEAIPQAEVIFIAVGTPSDSEGRADLSFVEAAADSIGRVLTGRGRTTPAVVVNKSTVPIGTSDLVGRIIRRHYSGQLEVVSNPEFLREGQAVADFMKPDRIVVGSDRNNRLADRLIERLYAPLKAPILHTDVKTAELIKYASNAYLATSISFINSLAGLAEAVGADIDQVAAGMRLDARIGPKAFLDAGVGYGGSCLPKDVKALIAIAHDAAAHFGILEAAEDVNLAQRRLIVQKVRQAVPNLRGATVAVWGLAFKAGTDDMREAPAIAVIEQLQNLDVKIQAYDPAAESQAKLILTGVQFAPDALTAARGADALVILTEWDEFKELDLQKLKAVLKHPRIIDGRNIYPLDVMRSLGFDYYSIGRPAVVPREAS